MNILEQLKKMTTVVADTGELSAMKQYLPEDATTNPSLILKVAQLPEGEALLARAAQWAQQQSDDPEQQHQDACDILGVFVGCEILKLIPGRVSTEVDAKLSYDTEKSIAKAERLIALYESQGVSRDRVLIKLASTWQGIKAAEKLEAEGIKCNLTLLFSFAQAQACAEAGAYLISPFVGRILDWYKKSTGEAYQAETDPGVLSVRRIYQYYKAHGYSTVVMGASFRNVGEIIALAGCDRLTIGPNLLDELAQMEGQLEQVLVAGDASQAKPTPMTESEFYWEHNSDPMAVEKLAEGIRNFAKDQSTMEQLISKALSASISA